MWRYLLGPGNWTGSTSVDGRQWWLDELLAGRFNPKAPKFWIAQQAELGRLPIAAYSIWAKYPIARKYAIWAMAEDEDAQAAGYLVG